ADLFDMDINAVYTRSINSPIVAAKAIHRDESLSVAYIGAVDEHSPAIIPLEERSIVLSDVGRSISNITRATYSFGNNARIGGLFTSRNFPREGSNYVSGLDGHIQLPENIEIQAQALFSRTTEATSIKNGDSGYFSNGKHTIEFDGESFTGHSSNFFIGRRTDGLDVELSFAERSPDFRAANGSIFQNDFQQVSSWIGYKFPFAESAFLKEFDMSLGADYRTNSLGERKYRALRPELDFSFPAQSNFHIAYRRSAERFHEIEFPDIYFFNCWGGTHPTGWMDLNFAVTTGHIIARSAAPAAIGRGLDFYLGASFKILGSFIIAPEYDYSRIDTIDKENAPYYSGAIYRTRLSYQFSRELSARLIVQYNEFASAFEIDPLLTYQINPLSSFYLGSSHNYRTFDQMDGLIPSDRQFFAKFQYLFQD
ncbi:MAG: hypothetical protein ABI778_06435, partial [Ignavibacteriota bacterium]